MGEAPFLVAVHCGAGFHSKKLEGQYKKTMENACKKAASVLRSGGSSQHAVASATVILEDCPITNAGLGSNLTEDGRVECDASLMTDDGSFGAIGACPGVANPVLVAERIAKESRHAMPLGRVRPILLVGEGARQWAKKRGLSCADSKEELDKWLVTKSAEKQWRIYKAMIDNALPAWELSEDAEEANLNLRGKRQKINDGSASVPGRPVSLESGPDIGDSVLDSRGLLNDTVGCICIDSGGRCAASVSSGGIAVKAPGRVGEAAIHGSGCWAESRLGQKGVSSTRMSVACSVTGVGENIMRAALARKMCEAVLEDTGDLSQKSHSILQAEILETPPPGPPVPSTCGVIILRAEKESGSTAVEITAAHCSDSMAFAYFHQGMNSPSCKVDRIEPTREAEPSSVSVFGARTSWKDVA